MSIHGISTTGNVTTSTVLTSNKLIKGNGTTDFTISGISCDSSNNLVIPISGTTNMYDTVSYTFAEDSTSVPSFCEFGMRFTIASTIVVTGFRGYRTTNVATTKSFTLWNGSGVAIATASTTGETVGAWTTSGALNTGPLTLTAGNYTLSYTVQSIYTPKTTTGVQPITINGITQNGMYHHITPGQYPTTLNNLFQALPGIDLVWQTLWSFTLSPPTTLGTSSKTITFPSSNGTVALASDISLAVSQRPSTGSMSGSINGQPKVIFGKCTSASTPVYIGSNGLSSIIKNGTGSFTLNYVTAFSQVPAITANIQDNGAGYNGSVTINASSTTGCTLISYTPGGAAFDYVGLHFRIEGF